MEKIKNNQQKMLIDLLSISPSHPQLLPKTGEPRNTFDSFWTLT
jgi:hypothetical protein